MANDPNAAARAAMAEDAAAVANRDQIAWDAQVRASAATARQTEAQAALSEAYAIRTLAQARLWRIAGTGVAWLFLATLLWIVLSSVGIGQSPW